VKHDHLSLVRHPLRDLSIELRELRGTAAGSRREVAGVFQRRHAHAAICAPTDLAELRLETHLQQRQGDRRDGSWCTGRCLYSGGGGADAGIGHGLRRHPFFLQYQQAQNIVGALRNGEATRGRILDVQQNYHVRINGRNPWVIRYEFQAGGQAQESSVSTLNQPGERLQAGKPVYVLYLASAPQWNSIYPHP
jgi:hypothetical protein